MSEPMFPSAGQAAPETAALEPEKSNRKVLVALGGVLAALVVGGGAFLMMSSGGGDDDFAADGVVQRPAVSNPDAGGAATPQAKPAIKPASINIAKRDPFAPLFPSPTATVDPNAGDNPGGPGQTGGNGGGVAPPATDPTPVTPAVSLSVTTIDVNGKVATVTVDTKKYAKLKVGDSFGGFYTLYSIFNDQCVGVLYGDQSVPVCKGKPASVTP